VAELGNHADALALAALRLAAGRGWRGLSLVEVATEAGIGLADAYAAAPSKAALLAAIIAGVDRRVLAGGMAADGDTPRDRLFEILMRRFDALQEQRDGYVAILNDILFDPLALLPALSDFARSMAWMLEAAAIPAHGPLGNLRTKALAVLYLNVLRTWRSDDSLDLARTMAALDRDLGRIEEIAGRCPRLAGTGGGANGLGDGGDGPAPGSASADPDSDSGFTIDQRPSDV
jgi:AcrR family transcriptional regulator